MLKYNFKISIRNIIRHPVYSIINILGLTIGITCFILIMLWVKHELSYDRFHKNAGHLYRVVFTNEQHEFQGYWQPGALAQYLQENFPEVQAATSYNEMQLKVAYEKKGFNCSGSFVDTSFFNIFSFEFIQGDADKALALPGSIVITKSLSSRLFGDENPIGKTVKVNDWLICSVTGVIYNIPENSTITSDFLIPFSNAPDWMHTWNSKCTSTYVLIKSGADIKQINKKIRNLMNSFRPEWKNILYLKPMTESHLYSLEGRGMITYVLAFSVLAFIILLLACINFMNLSTARSEIRQTEIFIKKVNGSDRTKLLKQFLGESILLSLVAMLLSLILIEFLLPSLNNLLHLHLRFVYSVHTVGILILTSLITGILSGSYPAFYLSSFTPAKAAARSLINDKKTGLSSRNLLVLFQLMASVFFIVSLLSIHNQLKYIKSKDLGFNKDNILRISTIGKLQEKSSDLKAELLKNTNILNVTSVSDDFTKWGNSGPIEWEDKKIPNPLEVVYSWVDYNFLKTFDLKMIKGRFFSKDRITDGSRAFILNEKAVSEMQLDDPIGTKVKSWFGQEGIIIGVIKDFNTTSLHKEIAPAALLLSTRSNNLFIKLRSQDIPSSIHFIESKVSEFVPDDPFDYIFLSDQINQLYRIEIITGKLTTLITLLALFISCLGLFGLVLSTLEKRTKEVGIRKVNGAGTGTIMLMLSKDFTRLVILAFIIACPIAWYAMHKWLQNFAYKTNLGWWIFALSGLIAFVITLLTVSWQSWRAASRNPVEALRYE